MIPAGYMYKKVASRPDWLRAAAVRDIYSISSCISEDFTDYINYWRHNGYWLFDTPKVMEGIAAAEQLDVAAMTLFYYTVFDFEFDGERKQWSRVTPEWGCTTEVEAPPDARLEGYDVATFFARNKPECSPLSCNGLAETIPVNSHCLFETFEQARQALDAGKFDNSEPGPFRIFGVYTV